MSRGRAEATAVRVGRARSVVSTYYIRYLSMISKMQVLVRLDEETGRLLDRVARSLGVSRAEVVRRALRMYLARERGRMTRRMRGIVRPRLSMEELEELYWEGAR